jgi:hypothetical protein
MRARWGILGVLIAMVGGAAADDAIIGRVIGVDGRPSPGSTVLLVEEGRPLITFVENRLPDAPAGSAPRRLAQARREIEVPPLPEGTGRSDDPLILDPVTATVAARGPEVGESAPDFDIPLLTASRSAWLIYGAGMSYSICGRPGAFPAPRNYPT